MSYGFNDDKSKATPSIEEKITNAINSALSNILNNVWPIGSIYYSTSNNNPTILFGGTWERYAVGKVLVGYDSTDADFNAVNKIGGSKGSTYTPAGTVGNHTLALSEIPDHTHYENADVASAQSGSGVSAFNFNVGGQLYTKGIRATAGSIFGQPHNHPFTGTPATIGRVQPYQVVYIWRRIA